MLAAKAVLVPPLVPGALLVIKALQVLQSVSRYPQSFFSNWHFGVFSELCVILSLSSFPSFLPFRGFGSSLRPGAFALAANGAAVPSAALPSLPFLPKNSIKSGSTLCVRCLLPFLLRRCNAYSLSKAGWYVYLPFVYSSHKPAFRLPAGSFAEASPMPEFPDPLTYPGMAARWRPPRMTLTERLRERISRAFYNHGLLCASYPIPIILFTGLCILACWWVTPNTWCPGGFQSDAVTMLRFRCLVGCPESFFI